MEYEVKHSTQHTVECRSKDRCGIAESAGVIVNKRKCLRTVSWLACQQHKSMDSVVECMTTVDRLTGGIWRPNPFGFACCDAELCCCERDGHVLDDG